MNRPSPKELFNKIKSARAAVSENRVVLLNQTAMACDAIDLNYVIANELKGFLPAYLDRLKPDAYVGSNPPQKSYEPETFGLELLAFEQTLDPFEEPIYLKFTYSDDTLWLISFHPSNREDK